MCSRRCKIMRPSCRKRCARGETEIETLLGLTGGRASARLGPMERLIAGFRKGIGPASPSLVFVWLAIGAGLIWLQWGMSLAGIESFSGNVTNVITNGKFGTHITIDSTSRDFYFGSVDFPQLPEIRVGDHIDILSRPQPDGSPVAAQSQRGTWIDASYGDELAGFTPQTWAVHEVLRWSVLALGLVVLLFGAASFVRGIRAADMKPRLRAIDSVALGLLVLTAAWAAGAYESTVASKNGSIPIDVAFTLASSVWLPGLLGLIAGIAALADSKGRAKWPGVLALFSPLVAVFGWMMSFAAAWSGLQ